MFIALNKILFFFVSGAFFLFRGLFLRIGGFLFRRLLFSGVALRILAVGAFFVRISIIRALRGSSRLRISGLIIRGGGSTGALCSSRLTKSVLRNTVRRLVCRIQYPTGKKSYQKAEDADNEDNGTGFGGLFILLLSSLTETGGLGETGRLSEAGGLANGSSGSGHGCGLCTGRLGCAGLGCSSRLSCGSRSRRGRRLGRTGSHGAGRHAQRHSGSHRLGCAGSSRNSGSLRCDRSCGGSRCCGGLGSTGSSRGLGCRKRHRSSGARSTGSCRRFGCRQRHSSSRARSTGSNRSTGRLRRQGTSRCSRHCRTRSPRSGRRTGTNRRRGRRRCTHNSQ